MSNPWPFQDRRGMFQAGKMVHEPSSPPARRSSGSGGVTEAIRRGSTSSNSGLDKTTSNTSTNSASSPPPTTQGQRRKSSTSGGLFGNLTNMKRGADNRGEDYHERRESHGDSQAGGAFSGWYNKTFRGVQQPQSASTSDAPEKRGVME
ncbi:hypothetical protein LTS08_002048 [Lithohypha guttulata]|uniref:Uncharacterized protein n=1 Tax=Lithohypha guttulata TaxID=1690604 RepID=A0AAN7T6A9_9EURO|nr:hypothetical protein LTR51_004436 [Lithohypha guttulata]KAK5091043.1 hypothetical protein LTR05_001223 [Lithohypha guttulata]KAK5104163.1 hypothetical protein LTS08_002048 [Lithohypha guttulata]